MTTSTRALRPSSSRTATRTRVAALVLVVAPALAGPSNFSKPSPSCAALRAQRDDLIDLFRRRLGQGGENRVVRHTHVDFALSTENRHERKNAFDDAGRNAQHERKFEHVAKRRLARRIGVAGALVERDFVVLASRVGFGSPADETVRVGCGVVRAGADGREQACQRFLGCCIEVDARAFGCERHVDRRAIQTQ